MIFRFKKIIFFIFIISILSLDIYAENYWNSYIIHQNKKREFRLYVPVKYTPKYKISLVIVLHGGVGNNVVIERFTGFSKLAEKENFLVAYPQGYYGNWNDGREIKQSKASRLNIDDVGFISKMIDNIKIKYNVDEKRIYVAGISNGGFMALRLACELSEKIAGAASVCATLNEYMSFSCKPKEKVSILIMNGTDDNMVPFEGGEVLAGKQKRGKIKSTMWTVNYWIKINQCEKEPSLKILINNEDDETSVEKNLYRGKYGADVLLYKIIGGGHTWPGGSQYLSQKIIGKVSREIDATKEIWNFFKTHLKVKDNLGVITF